ncbi:hypothetical protein NDU88_001328 [Pleurodeles waltl]|uniref:Uncharacterized protein n=1 Tax=Pleurodeles waltl TaxID=8319 RepID=A0AAV7KSJ9_PLEWA|nr:hypothetical protein NDU88_001328 [Pleurodeles waltl]
MSADRTPSRARQCLFRRAFERFPFGRCERRARSRSYDVGAEASQDLPGQWTSVDTLGIRAVSQHPPQDQMDSSADPHTDPRTRSSGLKPAKISSEIYTNCVNVPSSTVFTNGLVSDSFPFLYLENPPTRMVEDYRRLNRMGSQAAGSASEPSTSATPRQRALSTSQSVSSMETDGDVDPETGERSLG